MYTKNGKGYVHDNIGSAVSCIQKLGVANGFKVETTNDASVMSEQKLKQFTMVIFASTNNDVFDNNGQRLAFRRYIEAGGQFLGIHAALATERNWTWFKNLLGGTLSWHAHFQKYKVRVIDKGHPSTEGLPAVWEKEDECYFNREVYPGGHVLLAQDLSSLDRSDTVEMNKIISTVGKNGALYPATWTKKFDGGTIFITALGHDKRDYSDPVFVKHIFQGMKWLVAEAKPLDYTQSYAINRDSPLKSK